MSSTDRPDWDQVWLKIAFVMATRSRCDKAKVGAVIVNKQERIVATGYNGPAANNIMSPMGSSCDQWCKRAQRGSNDTSYGFLCPTIHAEANALLYADRSAIEGGTIYITHSPCADCAKLISNSGIKRVIMGEIPPEHRPDPRPYLQECNIFTAVMPDVDSPRLLLRVGIPHQN